MKKGIQKNLAGLAVGAILVLSFQNCGDFALQDEIMLEQGLKISSEILDAQLLPGLLSSDSLGVWSKPDNPQFKNSSLVGDQWSVVAAVDRSATGGLIAVNNSPGVQEGRISVIGGKIRATRASSGIGVSFEEYKESSLPSSGDKMVVAATFGSQASEIMLMVNGIVQTAPVIVASGTPADFGPVSKNVSVNPSSGQVYEYVVYAGDSALKQGGLSGKELNVMSRYLATNNLIANVILDPTLMRPSTDVNAKFVAAKAYFDSKCVSCHSAGGTYPNLSGLTESKALQEGWVVKGSPNDSPLYYRLVGSLAPENPSRPKNMPQGSSNSASEIQVVADWINNIK